MTIEHQEIEEDHSLDRFGPRAKAVRFIREHKDQIRAIVSHGDLGAEIRHNIGKARLLKGDTPTKDH